MTVQELVEKRAHTQTREEEMAELALVDAEKQTETRAEVEDLMGVSDELLDEIDALLMEQSVVDEFRQKGGE